MLIAAGRAYRSLALPLDHRLRTASLVSSQASHGQASLLTVFTPEVQRWEVDILGWSDVYQLPAQLIATVMQIESCGDAGAISPAGAHGLFQVMPYHFEPGEARLDPQTNARRGLGYLRQSLDLAGGEIDRALAGYNGGHSVISNPSSSWPQETQRYVFWGEAIFNEAQSSQNQSPALQAWLRAGGAALCDRASRRPLASLGQGAVFASP